MVCPIPDEHPSIAGDSNSADKSAVVGSAEPTSQASPAVLSGKSDATASLPGDLLADDDDRKDIYRIKLDMFEGPLDLLLHLIRKHELDILDIPIGFITEKYLEYLAMMEETHIDVASEYLVMAATLAYIKSRMLLPPDPNSADDDEGALEESDPRGDLVRRLLEYQKYKDAALSISQRDTLGRDVFGRGDAEIEDPEPAPLASTSMFRLLDAFQQVLKRAKQTSDHQVLFERVSIAERMVELTERLYDQRRLRFEDLFAPSDHPEQAPTRMDLVITFLALLEMCKMRVTRIVQKEALGEIWVQFAPKRLEGDDVLPPSTEEAEAALAEKAANANEGEKAE